jgi:hypothetical protein
MPLQMELDSNDLRRLNMALRRLGEGDLLAPQLKMIGGDVMRIASKYPPALPFNPNGWWWERGWGWWAYGEKQAKTSDDLASKWYVKAFPSYAEIGNLASYAGWVHGDAQRAVHQRTGWLKLYDVALDNMPKLIEKAKANIRAIWEARA